jgi:hypothetical protein
MRSAGFGQARCIFTGFHVNIESRNRISFILSRGEISAEFEGELNQVSLNGIASQTVVGI